MEDFNQEIEIYREWSKRFNKLSFKDKVVELRRNQDIFTLTVNDEFRWGIKVSDSFIQGYLENICEEFEFKSSYITREAIIDLMVILGFNIENV